MVNSPFFEIADLFRVVKRRKKVILLIYVPFILLSIFLIKDKKKAYETKFTINNSGPFIDAQTLNDNFIVYYLNDLENNNNSVYKYLKDIQIRHSEDITNSIYTVNLKVYNINVVNVIVKELIKFCNKNPNTIGYINAQKLKRIELLDLTKKQLNNLQTIVKSNMSNKNYLPSTFHFNIFSDIATLEEKIIDLKAEEKENKGFYVSIEPTIPNHPKGANFIVLSLILIVSELLAIIVVVFFFDKFILIAKVE